MIVGEVEWEYVVYTENGSKNRSGSYKDRSEAKQVKHFADLVSSEWCVVALLKKYLRKLPSEVLQNTAEKLYFHPKDKTPDSDEPWFIRQHLGRNTLGKMVNGMCDEGQLPRKTNHSLRAIGATRMFAAQAPESLYSSGLAIRVWSHCDCMNGHHVSK